MTHLTRERVGVFGDAVIAIILTVMALELPVYVVNGSIDYTTMLKAIGVYAVSFCFIASLWIQHGSNIMKMARRKK